MIAICQNFTIQKSVRHPKFTYQPQVVTIFHHQNFALCGTLAEHTALSICSDITVVITIRKNSLNFL